MHQFPRELPALRALYVYPSVVPIGGASTRDSATWSASRRCVTCRMTIKKNLFPRVEKREFPNLFVYFIGSLSFACPVAAHDEHELDLE